VQAGRYDDPQRVSLKLLGHGNPKVERHQPHPFYDDLATSDHPHFIQMDQHAAFAVLVHQRSGPVKGIAVRPSDPSLAGMPAAFG